MAGSPPAGASAQRQPSRIAASRGRQRSCSFTGMRNAIATMTRPGHCVPWRKPIRDLELLRPKAPVRRWAAPLTVRLSPERDADHFESALAMTVAGLVVHSRQGDLY